MDDEGEVRSDVRYHKRSESGKVDVTDLCPAAAATGG